MSYEYQNHTRDTLGVTSKNSNRIVENFGENVDFWLFSRSFFFLLWVRNFWETDKLMKLISETSSVSISSKLVNIFGLQALCTKARKKAELWNRTLNSCFFAAETEKTKSRVEVFFYPPPPERKKHKKKGDFFSQRIYCWFLPKLFFFINVNKKQN